MSLHVCLRADDGTEIYSDDITHNLAEMAKGAGIYECLWRPEESGICLSSQIIGPLEGGLCLLVANKARFEAFNSPTGWGLWENLVLFCAGYLQACRDDPCASVSVSR